MIVVKAWFTAGQYAARPWGAPAGHSGHEWPPSPYRLIRAATAAWKYNLPDLAEDSFYAVVRRLASELPVFCLPRPEEAGRGAGESGREPAPWRIDPRRPIHAIWPTASLAAGERRTLGSVLAHVRYLGRTDSWCTVRLAGAPRAGAGGAAAAAGKAPRLPCRVNCRPYTVEDSGSGPGRGGRRVGRGPPPAPVRVIVPRRDVTMDEVYRRDAPSYEEEASACPDGAKAVPYLLLGGHWGAARGRQ